MDELKRANNFDKIINRNKFSLCSVAPALVYRYNDNDVVGHRCRIWMWQVQSNESQITNRKIEEQKSRKKKKRISFFEIIIRSNGSHIYYYLRESEFEWWFRQKCCRQECDIAFIIDRNAKKTIIKSNPFYWRTRYRCDVITSIIQSYQWQDGFNHIYIIFFSFRLNEIVMIVFSVFKSLTAH